MAAAPSVVPRVYHLISESESIKRFFSRMNEVKVLKEGYALSTDAGRFYFRLIFGDSLLILPSSSFLNSCYFASSYSADCSLKSGFNYAILKIFK